MSNLNQDFNRSSNSAPPQNTFSPNQRVSYYTTSNSQPTSGTYGQSFNPNQSYSPQYVQQYVPQQQYGSQQHLQPQQGSYEDYLEYKQ